MCCRRGPGNDNKGCCDVIITPGVLDQIEKLRQQAKRGPLHSAEFKILEIWAKHFPAAQELLDRRQEIGVKAKKPSCLHHINLGVEVILMTLAWRISQRRGAVPGGIRRGLGAAKTKRT